MTGWCNSRDTTGEGCELFCNSCFNKQSVTVTVTVTGQPEGPVASVTATRLRAVAAMMNRIR